jgi:hypothetical protein
MPRLSRGPVFGLILTELYVRDSTYRAAPRR